MWCAWLATAWGAPPDSDFAEAEWLDAEPLRFGERPAVAGPRRASKLEAEAALWWTRAGTAVDPSPMLARRDTLLTRAVRTRERALRRDSPAEEHVALAFALQDLGRSAEDRWSAALALDADGPWAPHAHLVLAMDLERNGHPEPALAHLAAAAADPLVGPHAAWRAGWVAWRMGALDPSVDWFTRAAAGPDPVVAADARRDGLALARTLDEGVRDDWIARLCPTADLAACPAGR